MDEISFGDVQHAERQTQRRPDKNKHYAVVPVFEPADQDLRIYVDVDALRDMETHALSDTSVELGGVLLGGHYEDEDGRPFVVVTDSLRAEHYESTKGSFKFTHDTWSKITREREEFPEDLQMVGWYHTHPDWGVFLSGMDMFICDNFFNKPLDVALVIDPCRDDRGFFQWTNNPSQRKRRTGGFYLIGSRFRVQELELMAAKLEGKATMTHDPRFAGYSAPVVNIADRGDRSTSVAIMAMLTVQFCLLALLAWRLLAPMSDVDSLTQRDEKLERLERRIEELKDVEAAQAQVEAQRRLLDRVVGDVRSAPQGLITALEEERQRGEQLEAAVSGQLALRRELEDRLKREQSQRRRDVVALKGDLASLEERNEDYSVRNKALSSKIASLEARLEEYEPKEPRDGDSAGPAFQLRDWTWYIVGGVAVLLLCVVGVLAFVYGRDSEESMFTEEPPDEPRPNSEEPPE